MSYFIIIRGPAGIGKTIIGKRLAKHLKGECISIDKELYKNKLGYVIGEKWVPEENFLKVNKILIPYINVQLKKKRVIVLEGNFYHKSQIQNLIQNIPYEHFIFTLKADIEECVKRDSSRKGRKIGKQRIKDVYKLVSKIKIGISINSSGKNESEVVEEIIKYLPK